MHPYNEVCSSPQDKVYSHDYLVSCLCCCARRV